MSYSQQQLENAAIGIAVTDTADNFSMLRKPGVAAVIWCRQLAEEFQTWINHLPVENLPSARVTVATEIVRDAVEAIFGRSRIPYNMNRRFFVDDVVSLAGQFAEMMNVRSIGLRFDVVHDDACRKFHIDAVSARLVCTYRGPGTQYGISADGQEPKRVFKAPTGAPILLRGTRWPDGPPSGLLHRSPPIEGTDETRLVLVIDPIFHQPREA